MQDEQTTTTPAPPEPAQPPTTEAPPAPPEPAQPPTTETKTTPPNAVNPRKDFYDLLDEFRGLMPFQFVAKYEQTVDKHHPKA